MRDLSIVEFAKGDVIFREGELSDALYFLLPPSDITGEGRGPELEEGKLTSETEGGDGEEQHAVSFLPVGRYFGENGVVYRYSSRLLGLFGGMRKLSPGRAPASPGCDAVMQSSTCNICGAHDLSRARFSKA